MKKGDSARQIVQPIEGVIVGKQYLEDGDKFQYLLEYETADSEVHQTWFDEGALEVIKAAK